MDEFKLTSLNAVFVSMFHLQRAYRQLSTHVNVALVLKIFVNAAVCVSVYVHVEKSILYICVCVYRILVMKYFM